RKWINGAQAFVKAKKFAYLRFRQNFGGLEFLKESVTQRRRAQKKCGRRIEIIRKLWERRQRVHCFESCSYWNGSLRDGQCRASTKSMMDTLSSTLVYR